MPIWQEKILNNIPERMMYMGKKDEKTNVMRILEQKKISYQSYNYLNTGAVSGVEVAQALERIRMLFSKRWSQRESPEIITCSLFLWKKN